MSLLCRRVPHPPRPEALQPDPTSPHEGRVDLFPVIIPTAFSARGWRVYKRSSPDAACLPHVPAACLALRNVPFLGTGSLRMTQAGPKARRSQCRAVEESQEEQPTLSSTSPTRSSQRGTSEGRMGRFSPNPFSPLRGSYVPPPGSLKPGFYSDL